MVGLKKLFVVFFLCWMTPNIVFYYLPVPVDSTSFQISLTVFFFIGFYLILASSLAYQVMIKVFQEEKKRLYMCIFFSSVLFLSIYTYVYFTEHSSILVSSISTANLLFVASVIGAGLSSAVKRTAELVPICITAAVADLMSVMQGPTKEMIGSISNYYEKGMVGVPPFVDFIVVKIGIPGFSAPMPLFGITDWIFLVLISASMVRLQKSDNLFHGSDRLAAVLYFPVAAVALFIALVLAKITNSFIPAMVVISAVFLLFLAIRLRVYMEMRKVDVLYCVAFPAVVTGAIFIFPY